MNVPLWVLIVLDALVWLAIHMGVAWIGTRMPQHFFQRVYPLFRVAHPQQRLRLFEKVFRIKAWKDSLPDGAAWFRRGFPKASIRTRDRAYLQQFLWETCRAEAVHVVVILASPLFFLWNPPDIAVWMPVYAVAANLPCIMIQQYNRIRLATLLTKRNAS
jgi:glycosyl-4,4'-diaponeurosporenoate acyltransferase